MEGEAILQTMAEVSVALAGFTGVVAAFGQRSETWTPFDTIRFRIMLRTSLWAVGYCIIPFALHHLGANPSATWATSSALLAGSAVIGSSISARQGRRLRALDDPRLSPGLLVFLGAVVLVSVVTQVLNALGIGFHRTFGAYFLGVCCTLLISALMFIRLLSFVGQQTAEE